MFARFAGGRHNRGRVPELVAPAPPPFATISAPSAANEGDDPAISATAADPLLSLTLQDISPVVDVSVQSGVVSPYSTTYPNVTPGTRQVRFFNEANPAEATALANIVVSAQAATISSPTTGASFTIGDLVTFTADGTADGWDANTTKVEFYVAGVLKATANSATLGAWTTTWNTTSETPAAGLAVVARRYWVGAAAETGTVDSASVSITLTSGAAFAPTDIAGCVLWFDMQDAASFTQAGTVTSITNKVSAVAATEATNPPGYSAAGLNGFPCMTGNGTSQRMIGSEAAVVAALLDSHAYTIFVVGSITTADRALEYFFGVGASATSSNRTRGWGASNSLTGRWVSFSQNDAGTAVTALSAGGSDTTPHVFCFHSPGSSAYLDKDQGASDPNGTAQDPVTLTADRFALFCRPDLAPDGFLAGAIGEVAVYDSELSLSDRVTVAAYLKAKWTTP